jgi:hypothetical protein
MQLVVGGKVCKRPKLLADNNCKCLPSSHEKALVVRLENELKLQTKDWAGWLAGWQWCSWQDAPVVVVVGSSSSSLPLELQQQQQRLVGWLVGLGVG